MDYGLWIADCGLWVMGIWDREDFRQSQDAILRENRSEKLNSAWQRGDARSLFVSTCQNRRCMLSFFAMSVLLVVWTFGGSSRIWTLLPLCRRHTRASTAWWDKWKRKVEKQKKKKRDRRGTKGSQKDHRSHLSHLISADALPAPGHKWGVKITKRGNVRARKRYLKGTDNNRTKRRRDPSGV